MKDEKPTKEEKQVTFDKLGDYFADFVKENPFDWQPDTLVDLVLYIPYKTVNISHHRDRCSICKCTGVVKHVHFRSGDYYICKDCYFDVVLGYEHMIAESPEKDPYWRAAHESDQRTKSQTPSGQ